MLTAIIDASLYVHRQGKSNDTIIDEIDKAVNRKKKTLGGLDATVGTEEEMTLRTQGTAEKLAKKINRPMILIGG